jgi:hypothetical protein
MIFVRGDDDDRSSDNTKTVVYTQVAGLSIAENCRDRRQARRTQQKKH